MQLSTCRHRALDLQISDVVQHGDKPATRLYALNLQGFKGAEKVDPLALIVYVEPRTPNRQIVGTDEVLDGFIVKIFDVHIQISDEFLRWVFVIRWIVRSGHVDRSES